MSDNHPTNGLPARVKAALIVVDYLRPKYASEYAPVPELPPNEAAARNAACKVLTMYLLGEQDYGESSREEPPDATVAPERPKVPAL